MYLAVWVNLSESFKGSLNDTVKIKSDEDLFGIYLIEDWRFLIFGFVMEDYVFVDPCGKSGSLPPIPDLEEIEAIKSAEYRMEQLNAFLLEKKLYTVDEESEPAFCIEIWQPVCGIDGKTYSNSCFAEMAHVPVSYQGECSIVEPIPEPVEMEFYQNERYDFSFEMPMDWRYQEGVTIDEVTTFEVIIFPKEFSLENTGDDANLFDLQTAFMGLSFQIESPMISVNFENLPKSKVANLSEENLNEHFLESIKTIQPSAKIIDSWSYTHPWGWEVYALYTFDLNLGFGSGVPYYAEETTFYFKDRESFNVSYESPQTYYVTYQPVYFHVMDTMVIKSVKVPEFHEIAIMVLGSGIIGIIAISKKFKILNS